MFFKKDLARKIASSGTRKAAGKSMDLSRYRIAVLVPCYNEETAVARVVADFRRALPSATVFVFDNNSSDNTAVAARAAGAEVFLERHQGKGFVVRRMFTDIEADIYVLVDGDATYDAPSVRQMIAKLLAERLDMVVASRVDQEEAAYRAGHRTGNKLLTSFVASVFGPTFKDMLSGYRVFSRRPRVTVSSTRPTATDRNAVTIRPIDRMAVGNRGTKPVSTKVTKIGIARPIEAIASAIPMPEKNVNGRSAR